MGVVCGSMVISAALALWALISPESAWRVLVAWRYRNPEAHEPSQAGYAVQRVAAVVALVTVIAVGLMLASAFQGDGP